LTDSYILYGFTFQNTSILINFNVPKGLFHVQYLASSKRARPSAIHRAAPLMCLQFSRAPSNPSEDAMEPLSLPSVTTFLYFLLSRLCCCHSRVVFYPNSSSRGEGQDSIHPFLFSSARVLIAITNFRSYTGHTSTDTTWWAICRVCGISSFRGSLPLENNCEECLDYITSLI